MKTIDGLLQSKQLSTSIGGAAGTVGTALGAKALAGAGKAIANTDIPNIDNPFGPKPVDPSVVDPSVVDPNNVVPPKPTDPTVVPGAETQTITVKQGDTLSQLADTHKVNPDELAKLNPGKFGPGDNPNILHPGDQIVLPKNIDAAAYKGAYQGDNAMTAQNILNKQQAGQYGADGGMAAKAVAKAKAGAGKAVAAKGATAPAQAAAGGMTLLVPLPINLHKRPRLLKVPFSVAAISLPIACQKLSSSKQAVVC
jgi:LysM repeat protein